MIGAELTLEDVVTEDKTARHMKSGEAEVLATPVLVAFMENVSLECVKPFLEPGCQTMGTAVDIKHLAATPVGMKVRCRAEVLAQEGRKITFRVEAWDEVDKRGEGTHERFIVNTERFVSKAYSKKEK